MFHRSHRSRQRAARFAVATASLLAALMMTTATIAVLAHDLASHRHIASMQGGFHA